MQLKKWRDQTVDWLASAINALPEPVFVVEPETRVIAANAPAFALAPAMQLGQPLVHSLRSPDILDAVGRVLNGGVAEKAIWDERAPVERWFESHIAPLNIADFEPAALISLREQTEARRIERMRVDFVANASHELRTPLASVLGFVETLQGPAKDDAVAREKFLGIMRDQAQRMARLVDDLLSLSRIEQHLHVRPATPVDLSLLVAHIIDTLTPMAAESGMTLAVEMTQNVVVPGDRDELARVVENLIENAIKYGRGEDDAGKRVEISLTRKGAIVVFSVRDHGAGVAPAHLPRLTERFYRVDAGKSRAKGGTGLGLAIVKHIVLRHQGRLTIDSTLGQGAFFRVTLPAAGSG